ncbi:MAG: GntR family transcriptional regulator [Aurantimonas coralicida]|mgnify:FL=1|jgi:DNA-binding GntR family transcriptional regulator|nr:MULTISPECIES: GntR family transcriptional regulator [Aurantimonas]MCW7543615.1 GntR family transcriptional regulator [Aurantimonas litoralis]MBC6717891.1 GntR family transcriptional regulator [Aurantimonas sp. DM33-3]MCC4299557.1 GntR family transcriptional regulator [Aurantimonas coralicida]MCD1644701.1 GntR family transcriptional regulator [Aurantimonas coralicida]MDE0923526.1 GntR family transcriptional regulator [Aurantimonas coralicida]
MSKSDVSRGETAYQQLKAAIQAGEMPPGSRVRELEIAERLGLSRTPAREAIRRLEAEGLISFTPRFGAVVSKLDHQETIELYDIREVLEGAAAGFAARHASVAEIEELEELIASEVDHFGQSKSMADLNRLIHSAIYHAAHNRFLKRSLIGLRDSMALLGGTTLRLPGRDESAHNEHLAILAAIKGRDPKTANEAAQIHIRNAQRSRLKLMRQEYLSRSSDEDEPGITDD